jgi:hypothetical protein
MADKNAKVHPHPSPPHQGRGKNVLDEQRGLTRSIAGVIIVWGAVYKNIKEVN